MRKEGHGDSEFTVNNDNISDFEISYNGVQIISFERAVNLNFFARWFVLLVHKTNENVCSQMGI